MNVKSELLHKWLPYIVLATSVVFANAATAGFMAGENTDGAAVQSLPNPKTSKAWRGPKGSPQAGTSYVEGEVLVKFRKGIVSQSAVSSMTTQGLQIGRTYPALSQASGSVYLQIKSRAKTTRQLLDELQQDPSVALVSPNFRRHVLATPNDPKFGDLWGLHNTGQTGGLADADIDAPEAWNVQTSAGNVVVAVIDSGVDYNHPDLAANIWTDTDGSHGYDFVNRDNNPMDDNGHGTHCAGTIGAVGNNGIGVAGVNWTAKIMALKVLDENGSGYDSDIIGAYNRVILKKLQGVNIVVTSNSYGGGGEDPITADAINVMNQLGILFVAAAGNNGSDNDATPHYPSNYDLPNVISVAASNASDALAGFSNYGATTVDLAAPGQSILSTVPAAYVPKPGDIFFDDMESGANHWVTGALTGTSTWAITTEQSRSPTHAWSDSPGANYPIGSDTFFALNQDIDLQAYANQGVAVGFWVKGRTETDYDSVYIDFSGDGGQTWTYGPAWSVNSPDNFVSVTTLIPETFKTAKFRMRIGLYSDDSYVYDGVYIDDVGIGVPDDYSTAYAVYSGTSMATPHVAGAVALVAAQFPTDTAAQRKQRILRNVDLLPGLAGKTVTGGRLNLAKSFAPTFVRLNVSKAGTGFGAVASTTPGINCGPDCSEDYLVGVPVTLKATATAGSIFTGWTGACTGITNPCTVSMSAAKLVTATFSRPVLTVSKVGSGAVISAPAGISCGADCSEPYNLNTSPVTLTAFPAAGYTFAGWSGACANTAGACTVTMNAAKTVTANFKMMLKVIKVGHGLGTVSGTGINCGADCSEPYILNTSVTLTASPTPGSTFTGWTGCTPQANPRVCKVTMSAAKIVKATFTRPMLTVAKTGAGTGTVVSSPAGISCNPDCSEPFNFNTVVTLTARTASGSTFTGWTGCTPQADPKVCKVTMSGSKSVTANFR